MGLAFWMRVWAAGETNLTSDYKICIISVTSNSNKRSIKVRILTFIYLKDV